MVAAPIYIPINSAEGFPFLSMKKPCYSPLSSLSQVPMGINRFNIQIIIFSSKQKFGIFFVSASGTTFLSAIKAQNLSVSLFSLLGEVMSHNSYKHNLTTLVQILALPFFQLHNLNRLISLSSLHFSHL